MAASNLRADMFSIGPCRDESFLKSTLKTVHVPNYVSSTDKKILIDDMEPNEQSQTNPAEDPLNEERLAKISTQLESLGEWPEFEGSWISIISLLLSRTSAVFSWMHEKQGNAHWIGHVLFWEIISAWLRQVSLP